MSISKPVYLTNNKWLVQTSNGPRIFEDGETAYDYYLINKHISDNKPHGNTSNPR